MHSMHTKRRIPKGLATALALLFAVAGGLLISASPADGRSIIPKQLAVPSEPDGNATCLECHSKPHTMVREGKEISTQVDPAKYGASVHGIISCSRCHLEAGPEHSADPEKPLPVPTGRERNVHISAQCTKCHAGLYEESYNLSFHGIAIRHGDYRAATCVDCHGVHEILPSRDALSLVSRQNLAATCGTAECHPGAPAGFAEGTEHIIPAQKDTAGPLHIVYKFFIALILFDTMKDGPIVMFELLRRLQK